jgi:hypothetical protein
MLIRKVGHRTVAEDLAEQAAGSVALMGGAGVGVPVAVGDLQRSVAFSRPSCTWP